MFQYIVSKFKKVGSFFLPPLLIMLGFCLAMVVIIWVVVTLFVSLFIAAIFYVAISRVGDYLHNILGNRPFQTMRLWLYYKTLNWPDVNLDLWPRRFHLPIDHIPLRQKVS